MKYSREKTTTTTKKTAFPFYLSSIMLDAKFCVCNTRFNIKRISLLRKKIFPVLK